MTEQIDYYNHFAEKNKSAILACREPHLWTTDYDTRGRIYQEMKERITKQEELIEKHFNPNYPILDVGCGFGRQAYLLAKKGFEVTGTDTSKVFVAIANKLFEKHNYQASFFCMDIMKASLKRHYPQILLLDVLEHIPPAQRKFFIQRIYALTSPGGTLLVSLPHVKKRISSQLNNNIRRAVTGHFSFFRNLEEHPYPIPQKNRMINLTGKYYIVTGFHQTKESDYYIFEKR